MLTNTQITSVQCSIHIGLAQSCNLKKLKVYNTKQSFSGWLIYNDFGQERGRRRRKGSKSCHDDISLQSRNKNSHYLFFFLCKTSPHWTRMSLFFQKLQTNPSRWGLLILPHINCCEKYVDLRLPSTNEAYCSEPKTKFDLHIGGSEQ